MILVTGSLAFDHIMDFPGKFADHIMPDKLHILNLSFLVPEMRKSFGGTAGNIAYTLALLGIDVSLFGLVGSDFEKYGQFLEKNKVNTSFLKKDVRFYTSTAFGITDCDDNQIWGFYPGADNKSHKLSLCDLDGLKIELGIIAPHNFRSMVKFAREYQKMKIPYLFDPGMQLRWLDKKDLLTAFLGAKIIIGNDYEVKVMEKTTDIDNLHSLSKEGKIVITTMGDRGSLISYNGKTVKIKAAKPKVVKDPSGAGDAYRSGFVAGFVRGFDLKTCGQMGSLAAVWTVEKYGTTTHRFTLRQFCRRYKENFGEDLKLDKLN